MKKKLYVLGIGIALFCSTFSANAFDFKFNLEVCMNACNMSQTLCEAMIQDDNDVKAQLRCFTSWIRCKERCIDQSMQAMQ